MECTLYPEVWTPASGSGTWTRALVNTRSWDTSHSPQVGRVLRALSLTRVTIIMILPGMELKDNILVSGNADSTVKIWDILSGQCLQTLSGRKLQVK